MLTLLVIEQRGNIWLVGKGRRQLIDLLLTDSIEMVNMPIKWLLF